MDNIVEQTIKKAQGVAVVKLYPMVFDRVSLESVIPKFEGKDIQHYIGVFENGLFDEYYDSKVDSRCYWECDREEFDNLKIGDELVKKRIWCLRKQKSTVTHEDIDFYMNKATSDEVNARVIELTIQLAEKHNG